MGQDKKNSANGVSRLARKMIGLKNSIRKKDQRHLEEIRHWQQAHFEAIEY